MKKQIIPTKPFVDNYEYRFTFGKYKGHKLEYVIDVEPSYILWLSENDIIHFSIEILETAEFDTNQSMPPEDWYWPLDD